MKIVDDFLDQAKFNELQTFMMGHDIAWFYNDSIDYKEQKDKQIEICLYHQQNQLSDYNTKGNLLPSLSFVTSKIYLVLKNYLQSSLFTNKTISIYYTTFSFKCSHYFFTIAHQIVTTMYPPTIWIFTIIKL